MWAASSDYIDCQKIALTIKHQDKKRFRYHGNQAKLQRLKSLVKTNGKHGFDLRNVQFHYQLPLLQRDGERTTYSPSGHDIGYASLREYSLLPTDHSGLIAMRRPIPLTPFYHESGSMLVGAYIFPPFHGIRHLPAGDSKSRILLGKESTSQMIFEEICMIDLYFHKLNQSYFLTLNFCHAYRNDSILFVSKPRGQTLFLK